MGNRLYLRSDQNYLWSLDRAKGTVVFSRSIAPIGIPVLGLVAYENNLISVIGNKLVELDINSGKEQRVTTLVASTSEQGVSNVDLSIVAPPVRNSQYFYVAATDRRLHVFQADNLVQIFPVTADDDSLITTVLAEDNFVAFGTNAGDLVGMAPDAPKRLWQFKAPEAVAGAIVRDGNSFYFASVDTNVYRVDVAEGGGRDDGVEVPDRGDVGSAAAGDEGFRLSIRGRPGPDGDCQADRQSGVVAAGRHGFAGRGGHPGLCHHQEPYFGRHGQRDGQEALHGELRPGDQTRRQYDRCTNLSHGRDRPRRLS